MRKQVVSFLAMISICTCAGCERAAGNGVSDASEIAAVSSVSVEPEESSLMESMLGDLPPMVRVDGVLYYDTGKESQTLRCGVPDGTIDSEVKPSEIPQQDHQSNFGTGYGYQPEPDGSLAVEIDGKWMIFEKRDGGGASILFHGKQYDRADLSEETLSWLTWYNGLSEQEQLAVSSVPPQLLDRGEDVKALNAEEGKR